MRRITFLFVIFLCILSLNGYTQIPEQFNYQAVLRNSSGELISGQAVEIQISIIDNNAAGPVLFTESHDKITNAHGLVNLIIGTGTPVVGDISSIEWEADKKFIGVKVDAGSGLTDLGAFQLLSVPYALYASSASNLGSENIYIPEPDTLFAVKDHDGNVVFAVFPDGVKVIVDEATKGTVGGFAVSGRSPTKAEETEIFIVTPDSTRIYVNDTIQSKGSVGGFAVSGRSPTKGINENYLVVTQDSTRIYVNDSISTKGRVGGFAVSGRSPTKGTLNNYMEVTRDSTRIYISDTLLTKGSVGGFAVSGRSPTKAGVKEYFNITGSSSASQILNESRVMWYPEKSALMAGVIHVGSADSVGENSISLGYQNIAKGDWSQAFGYKSIAHGNYSTAIGWEAEAQTNSFAFGYEAKATGDDAVALGSGAVASANKSFAFGSVGIDSLGNTTGLKTRATGEYAYAIGLGCEASNKGAFALGANNLASGEFSTAVGFNTTATTWYSTAMGARTQATGWYSTAMGFSSEATANAAMAIGYGSISDGYGALAMGVNAHATGSNSVALGNRTSTLGISALALGSSTQANGWYSVAMGDGSIASGDWSFAAGASAEANNYLATAFGNGTIASCYNTFVMGAFNAEIGNTSYNFPYGDNPLFIVGNGTDNSTRTNALELDWIGNLWIAGALTEDSDSTLKENIEKLENVLPKVQQINPVYFTFKKHMTPEPKRNLGFIAQEVQLFFPELVSISSKGKLAMDYSKMTAVLLQAIKEQQEIIETEQKKYEALENEVNLLNEKIEMILKELENK
ncbi:MAG: tail fiber domain-containing protein [Bacteroidales bacterium]|nr:tail fiber domain-containing protein [Bacteroidales bacterium]